MAQGKAISFLLFAVVVLVIVVVLYAKGIISVPGMGGGGGGGGAGGCSSNKDCKELESCIDGKCVSTKEGPGPVTAPAYNPEDVKTIPPASVTPAVAPATTTTPAATPTTEEKTVKPAGGGNGAQGIDLNQLIMPNAKYRQTVSVGAEGGSDAPAILCPQGTAITQLTGRSGWYVDSIQPMCGYGGGVKPDPPDVHIGGPGGSPWGPDSCAQGFQGFNLESGDYLNRLQPICAGATVADYHGSQPGPNKKSIVCDDGEAVVGLWGRQGQFIDKLGLFCAKRKT